MKKILIILLVTIVIIFTPVVIFAAVTPAEKLELYVKTLENILLVHRETLTQILGLFKEAIK